MQVLLVLFVLLYRFGSRCHECLSPSKLGGAFCMPTWLRISVGAENAVEAWQCSRCDDSFSENQARIPSKQKNVVEEFWNAVGTCHFMLFHFLLPDCSKRNNEGNSPKKQTGIPWPSISQEFDLPLHDLCVALLLEDDAWIARSSHCQCFMFHDMFRLNTWCLDQEQTIYAFEFEDDEVLHKFWPYQNGCLQLSVSLVGTTAALLDMIGMPGTWHLCTMLGHVRGPKTIRSWGANVYLWRSQDRDVCWFTRGKPCWTIRKLIFFVT